MKINDFSKVLTYTKAPFIPALIMVKDEEGKSNPITVEWYIRTSIEPPMYAISIGNNRYSYQCLQNHRFFNIIIPSEEMGEVIKYCGSKSGKETDKINDLELDVFKGKLGLHIIKNARACFECEVVSQVLSGDHTIFVGAVKYSWLNEEKSSFIVFPNNR